MAEAHLPPMNKFACKLHGYIVYFFVKFNGFGIFRYSIRKFEVSLIIKFDITCKILKSRGPRALPYKCVVFQPYPGSVAITHP